MQPGILDAYAWEIKVDTYNEKITLTSERGNTNPLTIRQIHT